MSPRGRETLESNGQRRALRKCLQIPRLSPVTPRCFWPTVSPGPKRPRSPSSPHAARKIKGRGASWVENTTRKFGLSGGRLGQKRDATLVVCSTPDLNSTEIYENVCGVSTIMTYLHCFGAAQQELRRNGAPRQTSNSQVAKGGIKRWHRQARDPPWHVPFFSGPLGTSRQIGSSQPGEEDLSRPRASRSDQPTKKKKKKDEKESAIFLLLVTASPGFSPTNPGDTPPHLNMGDMPPRRSRS